MDIGMDEFSSLCGQEYKFLDFLSLPIIEANPPVLQSVVESLNDYCVYNSSSLNVIELRNKD
jgi:hypothetical protein